MQFELLTFPCGFQHTINPDDDEGNGKQLPHVEQHSTLEVHLNVFGVFDEEAECENQRQHKPEEETASNRLPLQMLQILTLFILFPTAEIEEQHHEDEAEIGQSLIELARMSGLYINPDLDGYAVTEFSRQSIGEMIDIGEEAAMRQWKQLKQLSKRINGK